MLRLLFANGLDLIGRASGSALPAKAVQPLVSPELAAVQA
jgi:hypothetical protein